MKVTLDIVLFLLTSIAVSVATVAGTAVILCGAAGSGFWWWLRQRRGRK
jgi:hypothetical protein